MEFDEWYDRMMDNGDSPLHYLVTQREKLRLAWNESRHISDTPILSAVPSEEEIEKLGDEYVAGFADEYKSLAKINFINGFKRGIAG